jgi:hypothetical protein
MNISKGLCTCLLLVLSLLAGCGSSAYLTASGNYAKALDDSASTLRGMKDYNSQMCQQRMQLDYLFHRIEDKKAGKPPIYWGAFPKKFKYPVTQADGPVKDQDWNTHCEQIQIGDAIVNKAISGLSAYAKALKTLSTKDYEGADVKSLADGAIDLAGKLNTPSRVTDIAKKLPDPLQQLSGVLLSGYAKNGVKKIVKEADPSVRKILDGIGKYIDALMAEELDVEDLMRNTLNAVDQGLSDDPMDQLQFTELASRWVSDLRARKEVLRTLSGALKDLQDAESALATAGNQPDPDRANGSKIVLGNAMIVIGNIQALNNAIQGKGGTNQ